jgi:hypothetical protein
MGQSRASQAARYRMTRQRLARQICAALTQYAPGLVLTAGTILGAYNGTCAYEAQNDGTTTGSIPTGVEPPLTFNDSAVTFIKVSTLELLRTEYGQGI